MQNENVETQVQNDNAQTQAPEQQLTNLSIEQLMQLIAMKQQQELQVQHEAQVEEVVFNIEALLDAVHNCKQGAMELVLTELRNVTEAINNMLPKKQAVAPVEANTAETTTKRGRKATATKSSDPVADLVDITGLSENECLDMLANAEDALPKWTAKSDDCRYFMGLAIAAGCNMQETIAAGVCYLVNYRGFTNALAKTYCGNNYTKVAVK